MRTNPESERLLDDILGDVAAPEFRAALLDGALRHARRRRQLRLARKSLTGAVVLLGLAAWLWNGGQHRAPELGNRATERPEPAFGLVQTRPLDPARIVETRPSLTRSITSGESLIATVRTGLDARFYVEINDDQLLLLFAGRPAALTRQGPHDAEFLLPE